MAPVSPYSTALELGRPQPNHITNEMDKQRVAAYWTYWDIFRNVPDAYVKVMREDDDTLSRRLVPSVRTIIEATNRYLAKDITITPQPLVTNPDGTTLQVDEATMAQVMKLWNDFAAREEFHTKFVSLKRWNLIRGDAILHLLADDTKADGTKLRVEELDPSTYFTIPNPVDPTRLDGVYLVTIVDDDEGEAITQRQEYRRLETGRIWTQLRFFEIDKWDDRFPLSDGDLEEADVPARFADSPLIAGYELPPVIDSLPVYHFRNNRSGSEPFGVSEVQGIETLLVGINQTATDEDASIALTGIGVYVTTSGRPKDDQGVEVDWLIAPASIIELEGVEDKFERVKGIDSIQPLLDHTKFLEGQAYRTTATSEVAIGSVDVEVAQSGIALAIQMSPVLAKNEEKELELKGKLEQFLYDWVNKWAVAFESVNPMGLSLAVTFGDPLPLDRVAVLKEITDMLTAKVISIQFAQKLIRERLGYDIPTTMLAEIVAEQQQMLDAVSARLDTEAGGGPAGGEPGGA